MPYKNLVKETTTTTGTGPFVTGGAVAGFRSFAAAYAVGAEFKYCCRMGSQYEFGTGKRTATTIERSNITDSSNGGALVNFAAGTKELYVSVDADFLNGVAVTDLPAAGSIPDTYVLEVVDPATGGSLKATVAALRTIFGGGGGTGTVGDTTSPTMNGSAASSNVTQSAATITWPVASDAVGVTGYEISKDGGTTWTNVGNVLTYTYSALIAGTTYPVRVRAYDAAGNKAATPLQVSVTTAASSDTTSPTMSGSLTTISVTSSGYIMNWPAGADNVGIVAYETSIDGGTTWTDVGNVLTRTVTSRPASTTDNLRVRARDAAGLYSNVLTATVTTSAAAAAQAYTITPYTGGTQIRATLDASSSNSSFAGNGTARGFNQTKLMTSIYWNVVTNPGGVKAATAMCGWSKSSTVPPAVITAEQNNGGQNGMIPMGNTAGNSFGANGIVWIPTGDNSNLYFHIMGENGVPQCMNPTAPVVVSNA